MEKCTFSSIPFKRNGHGTEKKKNGKEKKRQENGAKTRKSMRTHDAQVCKYYAYIRGGMTGSKVQYLTLHFDHVRHIYSMASRFTTTPRVWMVRCSLYVFFVG